MTLYGYPSVSVREPEDKNLNLQAERPVRAGCAMGNTRAEEASGAKDDRGGLLELLDQPTGGPIELDDNCSLPRIRSVARADTITQPQPPDLSAPLTFNRHPRLMQCL